MALGMLMARYNPRTHQLTHNNNNNNNSYIALYPLKIYKLAALYIINIKIRLTINNKKKKKIPSTINAYINIKMTKEKYGN